MKSVVLEDLLKDGYSRKYANFYLNILQEERESSLYDKDFMNWAHNNGFRAEVASIYDINDDNKDLFLTDYDYYRIWPINSWERIWINDKMTLKYMLANTEFASLMPKYYYYTALREGKCCLVPQLDNPLSRSDHSIEEFKSLLKEVHAFACKPCNGSTSVGFFKLSYDNEMFFFNDKKIDETALEKIVIESPNYVYTEYIRPSEHFAKMNSNIHTLRLVTINQGDSAKIVGGYFRIPNNNSGAANFKATENNDDFNIVLDIDPQIGWYGNAMLIFANRKESVKVHPDNGVLLEGFIPNYDELKKTVLGIADRFNTIEYMGFDIGITTDGFKCMEINSHPGIGHMQLYRPFFANPELSAFYKSKIEAIDKMSDEQKAQRVNIPR